jgi:hypothetical protein
MDLSGKFTVDEVGRCILFEVDGVPRDYKRSTDPTVEEQVVLFPVEMGGKLIGVEGAAVVVSCEEVFVPRAASTTDLASWAKWRPSLISSQIGESVSMFSLAVESLGDIGSMSTLAVTGVVLEWVESLEEIEEWEEPLLELLDSRAKNGFLAWALLIEFPVMAENEKSRCWSYLIPGLKMGFWLGPY